ncbi:hypothetical protein U0355_02335 [Salimicrobium sp. PL1-032A]|uniref:hypothetical protein n=1 Tax=Salimicrobium sp. PL1-032A TaxID=3095364 RepID=UPI0032613967
MKLLLRYVSNYKQAAIFAMLLMLIELIVELFQPLIMGKIIDEGILQEDYQTVVIWGGVLVLLSLAAFIAGITNSFFAARPVRGRVMTSGGMCSGKCRSSPAEISISTRRRTSSPG